MKIAIKGAVNGCEEIVKAIQMHTMDQIVCILDNDSAKIGNKIAGIDVVPSIKVRNAYREGKLDAVYLSARYGKRLLTSMYQELITLGVDGNDIYVCPPSFDDEYILPVKYKDWHMLDYIEFHISHACNLKCKGCCHFSSITKDKFPDYDTWNQGITRLHTLFPYIKRIHLLGGEPLMNPELSKYVERTRELYSAADIFIISNGILAKRLKRDTLYILKKNNVRISMTIYPDTYDCVEQGVDYLLQQQCLGKVHFATEFTKMLSKKKVNFPYKSTEIICHCPNLVGTKLYTCPIIAYLKDFNQMFNLNFPEDGGYVNLNDKHLTAQRLENELYSPFPLCDYCRSYLTEAFRASNEDSVIWGNYLSGDTPKPSDWLLD